MGCRFSEHGTGQCQLFDGSIEMPVNENGVCICEDDEDPAYTCESFEEE